MGDLQRSHGVHAADVRRLSREIQRMRRHHREQGVAFKMTQRQRTIARVLVCIHKGEPTAALDYLAHSKRTKWTDVAENRQVGADLREWWSGTDNEAQQAHLLVDESDRMMHAAMLEARRFAVDGILETWVDRQNVQKGINPDPAFVLDHAIRLKRRLGLEFSSNHVSCRRWLQRWRRRRNIHLRRENVRERQSVEEMHRKVIRRAAGKSSLGLSGFRLAAREWPKTVTIFWSQNRDHRCLGYLKSGPENGHRFWRLRRANLVPGPALRTFRRGPCGGGVITCSTWTHLRKSGF